MRVMKKVLLAFVGLLLVLTGIFLFYTNDFYRAENEAYTELDSESTTIDYDEGIIILHPNKEKDRGKAFIFYPGGKVEYSSYIPLLNKLAAEGLTSVVVKMPFNLAVFNPDAAEKVYPLLPDISSWYIGGHSLGGAMASSYVKNASVDIDGLILLAAYPQEDKDMPVLSIYGSKDQVLDQEKMDVDYISLEIDGGNHAYFGNYGEQDGDGKASISRQEQQEITVDAIIDFINER